MPRRKRLEDYPEEYFAAIKAAKELGRVTIPCEDHAAAEALRAQLYVFRSELRRQEHELVEAADALTFSVEGPKLILHITERPGVPALKEALDGLSSGN